jgi:phenylalanine-4-hydroxylase
MPSSRVLTELIPEHLRSHIAVQRPEDYTWVDHAAWRYIVRISRAFFAEQAHPKYLQGLEQTGISLDRIPLVSEMDEKLKKFGWRAVPVSGFIPPSAFMEFQSLGILPIACEMRTLDHLAYTPAPDIVHEAAGHAPILADPEYAAYLREYGEVSRKAIFSSEDMRLFEAIRRLSDVKEDPASTEADIHSAQQHLDETVSQLQGVSEAALLARMNWWTVEYGLVGTLDQPKIYGAGLLSSVGESYACVGSHVKKIPFTLECIQTSYDITRPQPQLFVTPSFEALTRVLHEFSPRMAYRLGGVAALKIAQEAKTVTTTVLDSGVQVSGILSEYRLDPATQSPAFLKYSGPVQLSDSDQELPNQGPAFHRDGFSSPIGRFAGEFKSGSLRFDSGIQLQGTYVKSQESNSGVIVATFDACTITWGDEILYRPEWGKFDLVIGSQVTSVFGGAADRAAYLRATDTEKPRPQKMRPPLTPEEQELDRLYLVIREEREKTAKKRDLQRLQAVWKNLRDHHPSDWLGAMELLELESEGSDLGLKEQLLERVTGLGATRSDREQVIERGLRVLGLQHFKNVQPGNPA